MGLNTSKKIFSFQSVPTLWSTSRILSVNRNHLIPNLVETIESVKTKIGRGKLECVETRFRYL